MTKLQLEVDHCHAVCADLRDKLDAITAERDDLRRQLSASADLTDSLLTAIAVGEQNGLTVKDLREAINLAGKKQ